MTSQLREGLVCNPGEIPHSLVTGREVLVEARWITLGELFGNLTMVRIPVVG